jgi:hypothetical protein
VRCGIDEHDPRKLSLRRRRHRSRFAAADCDAVQLLGAIFAHRARSQARLVAGHDAVSAYVWGDRTIEFYHCRHCGCCTHYEDVEKNTDSRFSINARCLDPEVLATLRVRRFDGAKTWQFLD